MFKPIYAALEAFFVWVAPKIAVFFGIYVIADTVTKPIFEWLKAQALAQLGQAGAQFSQFFTILGVYDAFNIIFAAYLMALSIKAGKMGASAR